MALSREKLQSKLITITSELLKEKGYISFVDVFIKLGYLDPKDYENWRMKRVPYLERVIKINLGKINSSSTVVGKFYPHFLCNRLILLRAAR
jgi:hypothetical protein